MSYPAISLTTATVGRHRHPQKRLQTAADPASTRIRAPTIHVCYFLSPLPVSSPRPSLSIGGFGLSVGELVALVRGVARLGQEEYNQLQQEIRASPVVYGDETGWREAGRNGNLWSFSNPEVRYFLRRGSRGSKVVAEVLGDEFDGVLVSDFYGAYNVHQGLHQRCWTHLLRDIHQLKEKYPQH